MVGMAISVFLAMWGLLAQVFIVVVAVPVYLFAYIPTATLSRFLALLNRISGGRALGGLGIVLALIGLSFETYQVITIHYG